MAVVLSLVIVSVVLIVLVIGASASSSPAKRGHAKGKVVRRPPRDSSPFDYDDDDPMAWWDNQFGSDGFED